MRSFANPALLCWILAQILVLQAAAHDPGSSEKVTAASRAQEGSASAAAEQPLSSYAESSSSSEGTVPDAEAPGVRRMGKHKSDKSVAGGGVIIGGLVTAIFAAVFCYIRVTRKRGGVY